MTKDNRVSIPYLLEHPFVWAFVSLYFLLLEIHHEIQSVQSQLILLHVFLFRSLKTKFYSTNSPPRPAADRSLSRMRNGPPGLMNPNQTMLNPTLLTWLTKSSSDISGNIVLYSFVNVAFMFLFFFLTMCSFCGPLLIFFTDFSFCKICFPDNHLFICSTAHETFTIVVEINFYMFWLWWYDTHVGQYSIGAHWNLRQIQNYSCLNCFVVTMKSITKSSFQNI